MTKIMIWNIRGLNSAKQREVVRVSESQKLSLCILVETKIKLHKRDKVLRKSFREWSCIGNYDFHDKGRIWVLYKEDKMKVDAFSKSYQMITCIIELNSKKFLCSTIYAKNSQEERKQLWADLDQVKNNLSWIALGHFNCIRYSHEKLGGDNPDVKAMNEFNT